jgi:hypothetical protein
VALYIAGKDMKLDFEFYPQTVLNLTSERVSQCS